MPVRHQQQERPVIDPNPRFRRFCLQANRLAETKRFYQETLDCLVTEDNPGSFVVKFGETEIEFVDATRPLDRVAYHFAFNIPENKIQAAVDWMAGRVPLARHPQSGQTIVHFQWLDAHSVYFWDPSGNLVELIAHHRLNNTSQGAFGPSDILCASEIGLVVDDVAATHQELKSLLGVDCYSDRETRPSRCENDVFCAAGDPNGFFIVVRRGRKWLMTDIPATSHPVDVTTAEFREATTSLETSECTIVANKS